MGLPWPLFRLFSSFQTNITIVRINICEKMLCPSSMRRRDSNPRPLEHESFPITASAPLRRLIKLKAVQSRLFTTMRDQLESIGSIYFDDHNALRRTPLKDTNLRDKTAKCIQYLSDLTMVAVVRRSTEKEQLVFS